MMKKYTRHFNNKWFRNSRKKLPTSNIKINLLLSKIWMQTTLPSWINSWWNNLNFWLDICLIWNFNRIKNNKPTSLFFIITTLSKPKRLFLSLWISRFSSGKHSKKTTTNKTQRRSWKCCFNYFRFKLTSLNNTNEQELN